VKAYTSIEKAQEGLLIILSQWSRILSKGSIHNLNVGDVNFVINENDTIIFVAFVRNNITVIVKNIEAENPISVQDIAIQTDSMIQK